MTAKREELQSPAEPIVEPARLNAKTRFEQEMLPDAGAAGFSHQDVEIAFFNQVSALIDPHFTVLDFGAGRGEWLDDDPVRYRRRIQDFRGRVSHVDGCDVDPVVQDNRSLDACAIIVPGKPLPYPDERFDLVFSRYVFEHLPDPEWAARELMRVIRPGGWLCVLTPNKFGYVAIASRMVPNSAHAGLLSRIQPQRKAKDVFPTHYRLNTIGAFRRYFERFGAIYYFRSSGVPAYHFRSRALFRMFQVLHKFLPPALSTALCVMVRKR